MEKRMNELTTVSASMDSREIAALTGKNHADVCRDIRSMLDALEVDESNFASVYRGGNGEDRRCYILPKRECLILASGYNVRLRAAIIDRWAELELGAMPKLPATYAEALRLAADQAERIEAQARQIELQAPAVAFVDRYVEAKATQPIRAVAKILGMREKDFIASLEASGIMYRLSGKLVPAAEHVQAGRFEVKAGEAHGHAYTQTRFTPKGIEWIAQRVQAGKMGK